MSRNIVGPIHTAAVGLGNLRFFASPLDGPRLPWFAVSDLFTCLAMDRSLRRIFYADIKRFWKKEIRAVWTETGETLIAPHFVAQGLIQAMIDAGVSPSGFADSYTKGGAGAMNALVAGMDPAARVNFAIEAYRNDNGIEGDFTHVQDLGRGIVG